MPPIAFEGFRIGSRVTIAGTTAMTWGQVSGGGGGDGGDGGGTISGSVWEQTASAGTSITMARSRSDYEVAPEGVSFVPTLAGFDTNSNPTQRAYDVSLHDKVYFWDFGEGYDYTAPTQVIAMDAADGGDRKNSRYTMGPEGSHVYRTPGTYTVRLAVYEPSSGKWGQYSDTITVGDPDVFFSGDKTLFVSTNGNYSNAPAGAQTFNSLPAAFNVLDAATTPHRIVLERGQTHTLQSGLTYQPPESIDTASLRIEARQGSGAKPIIQQGTGIGGEGAHLFLDRTHLDPRDPSQNATVFVGIDFRGRWNVLNETGEWYGILVRGGLVGSTYTVLDRCDFEGMERGWENGSADDLPDGAYSGKIVFVSDCTFTGWSDYAMFEGDTCSTFVLGSRLAQNPDAVAGGPKDNTHNNHGPHRQSSPERTHIIASDYFSCTGWSTFAGLQAIQPCLRWGSALQFDGSRLLIWGSAIEGPNIPLNPCAFDDDLPAQSANIVIDGNTILGGFQADRIINISHSGLTVRNNLIVAPATNYDRPPNSFVGSDNGGSNTADATTRSGPIRIYNNTLVNLSGSSASAWDDRGNFGFTDVVVENNVMHAPNAGNTSDAPFTTLPLFTPRYKGYQNGGPLDTSRGNPADTATLLIPASGSDAIDDATTGNIARTSFTPNFGEGAIITTRDRGAAQT